MLCNAGCLRFGGKQYTIDSLATDGASIISSAAYDSYITNDYMKNLYSFVRF